ncbi:DUF3368 domain-containing protein [Deltaproteobacteria bacterium TL4]
MIIVADSSPLIALASCQSLELLEQLYSTIKVPGVVFDEVTIEGKVEAKALKAFLKNKVENIDLSNYLIFPSPLGRGELEAMALYRKLSANKLLVDDLNARKVAKLNNISIIGSLGILLLAKDKKLIPEIKPRIDALKNSDIYISDGLILRTLKAAKEA